MDKGKGAWKVVIITRVVRVSLMEKETYELTPEGSEGGDMAIWRRKMWTEEPVSAETRVCLSASGNSKAACGAGVVK